MSLSTTAKRWMEMNGELYAPAALPYHTIYRPDPH
jgi:hypothetical protein